MKKICLVICMIFVIGIMTASMQAAANVNAPAESKKLEEANKTFAFNIFKQLNSEDKGKNVFISPYSISAALSMAYNGTGTNTKKAMENTLGFSGLTKAQINKGFKYINSALKQNDGKVELNLGNSIWIRNGVSVKQDFINLNKGTFNATVSKLDFSKKAAVDTINKWVSNATKKKINKIIDPPIPESAMLYLINAVYFKGQWTEQFDKSSTFDGNFTNGSSKTKKIRMMSRKAKIEYGEGNDYKAVRLPYGKGNTAMYCILPNKGNDINSFISSVNSAKWVEIKNSIFKQGNVTIRIPKFKMEYGIKELNNALGKLGMKDAFSNSADFSGIGNKLKIDKVVHKAVIEVNEEGSEAAAVTGITLEATAMPENKEFIADRPFLFIIEDNKTGTILFVGKVYDI